MSLYVTFHGGKPGSTVASPIPYVVSLGPDSGGTWTLQSANVLNLPAPADGVNELRDIELSSDGDFYLVNGYKKDSVVWKIPAGGLQGGAKPSTFTDPSTAASIDHPFALASDVDGTYCYISNQDTNVVVRVDGSGKHAGRAAAVNGAIPGSDFLPGTFVASQGRDSKHQVGFTPPGYKGKAPSGVSSDDGGLGYSPPDAPPISNSVRGVAVIGTTLYVADEVDNCVRTFDTAGGKYLGTLNDPGSLIQDPVHLLASGSMLYISSSAQGGAVLSYDTSAGTGTANTSLQAIVTGVANASGLTLDGAGNLYVASRTGCYINQYDYDSATKTFTPATNNPIIGPALLTDQPEFLLWVD